MNDIILIFFAAVSAASLVLTVVDKHNSKTGKRRVPEKHLLLLALLGGSFSMYCTMLAIRHKTRKKKFILGLPVIMLLQTAFAVASLAFLCLRASF